ncbi:TELO2-interacting protein 1 homolog isoform X2 [Denticeps clupeoides]|nr:TELO2-interacting protein 1 homolog isoform X2 [Denticeps clupeoides]
MLPGLGAAVSLLLALAQEKVRIVQVAALKCLQTLTLQCDCSQIHVDPSPEESRLIGSSLASFLPGITQSLSHVISGDVRQGHGVTVRAMKVWYGTVGIAMADSQLEDAAVTEAAGTPELGRIRELMAHRSSDWTSRTSERLLILLQRIISHTSAHQHWRVRQELVNLSNYLLSNCSKSLGECTGSLLETLVGAANDEEPSVRDSCSRVLKEVAQRSQSSSCKDLTNFLSENLLGLASSLPRLMRASDDQRKLFVLNIFLGYLKILGPQIEMVLNSAVHLQRISKALVQLLEMDVTDVHVVEERSLVSQPGTGSENQGPVSWRKNFVYFRDEQIIAVVQEICRMLGRYGNVHLLVDHFLSLYKESSVYRKQSALVLNEIITGAAGVCLEACLDQRRSASGQDLKSLVSLITEEYTSAENWNLPTTADRSMTEDQDEKTAKSPGNLQLQAHPKTRSLTIQHFNSNIWQICIQLDGISSFALALGADFQLLLMALLYPVLEKAGDESLMVSLAATSAIWSMCQACGYDSPKHLINSNADYLLNDITLNLGRPSVHPHAPQVLAAMFEYSDASLLPLLGDIVEDVLAALDLNYDQRAPLFGALIHSVMKALIKWFPTSARKERAATITKMARTEFNARHFVLEHKRQKELAEGAWTDELEEQDVYPPCQQENDGEKTNLNHISISKNIMERCIHLLSDPRLALRLKVLDVVENCVHLLSEEGDELLPLVHRCWPPLLQRLTNDHPLAVRRAFTVLCTMGETCKDFLRKRVSKEVMPKLTASLSRQAVVSSKAAPIYTQTLAYKLQLTVVEGLGPLCVSLDLADSDLDLVWDACVPYLSSCQPQKLQDACLSTFHALHQLDPDSCWLTLSDLYSPEPDPPPHCDLWPPPLRASAQINEFTENVQKLLQELQ